MAASPYLEHGARDDTEWEHTEGKRDPEGRLLLVLIFPPDPFDGVCGTK